MTYKTYDVKRVKVRLKKRESEYSITYCSTAHDVTFTKNWTTKARIRKKVRNKGPTGSSHLKEK